MKLHAVPHQAYRDHIEVEGSWLDIVLFLVGLLAIVLLWSLLAPGGTA